MHDAVSALVRYAKPRRVPVTLLGATAVIALQTLLEAREMVVPSAYGGTSRIPYRGLLPLLLVALTVGGLASSMAEQEAMAGPRLRRAEWTQLFVVTLGDVLLVGLSGMTAGSAGTAVVLARSVLIWTGLALVSGRIFGRVLCWILPLMTLFPIAFYGSRSGGAPAFWNWTLQPPGQWASWLLAALCMGFGLLAFALTPWRVNFLRSHLVGKIIK